MGSWIRVAKAWVQGGGTSVAAAQSTSLLQLSHQGTIVRQRVKCVRGSKSKLTGSVVRLKTSPRPLGVSHWVLKSPGCLIAGNCHRRNGRETPTNTEWATHFCVGYIQALTAVPTQRQSAMKAVEPVGQHSGHTRGVEEGCG